MRTILLPFILLLVLSACNIDSGTKKVGFLVTSFEVERFRKEADYFKAKMAEYGYEVILKDCDENHALQYERAKEMLAEEIDILIVIPVNIKTAGNIVDLAVNQDVPVVAYNRMIMDADIEMLIYSDNEFIGEVMTRSVLNKMDGGNLAVLAGDRMDPNAVEQKEAMDKMISQHKKAKNINVVYDTYIEDWNNEIAAIEFQQIAKVYEVNGIIAGNDAMANAIIDIIQQRNPDYPVYVSGQDGDQIALENIANGFQVATVYHPYDKLAGKAAEIVRDILENKNTEEHISGKVFNGLKEVPVARIRSEVITRENVESYIEE
ncbi:substrate-binding domain-containing protein [Marinilabilia rubra]|uniref:Periplasmic binding protein domain-containing protein n=1 Tax=Marinilabilia rubra TaxID=2162893 RepID=A0A2U2B9U1_9BACT|nr:substrate-binding domain-containing protein [Marinilabilia rubra]PWD99812.1 hypothetical protein DDZ16_07915 [Marinilabilia rubra]